MSENSTIFDDVFRTMVEKLPQLVIPLINEVFHTGYPEDEEIVQLRNEYHEPDGEIITDSILKIRNHLYHVECQSTDDTTMAIRMFQYDLTVAIGHSVKDGRRYDVEFPQATVLYLRSTDVTPDRLEVDVKFADGFTHVYWVPAIKAYSYTKNEIFEKKLLFLLPFYIMRYEKQKHELAADEQRLQKLLDEYEDIRNCLTAKDQSAELYTDLIGLIIRISDYIFAGEEAVKRRFKSIMGGKVLELESERLMKLGKEKGKAEGRAEGKAEGKAEGEQKSLQLNRALIADNRMDDLVRSTYDAAYRKKLYAEYGIS